MRRKKSKSFNITPYIVILVFLAILSAIFYFAFERSTYISCGILLETKENSNTIDLKIGYEDNIKWVRITKKMGLPKGIAYNISFKGISVKSIIPCKVYTGKILSRNNKSIELNHKVLTLGKNVFYYKISNNMLIKMSPNDLIVGTTHSKFIENNNRVAAIIIYPPDITAIRVGISDSEFASLDHYNLLMHSSEGFIVTYNDGNSIRVKNNYIKIDYNDSNMKISTYYKSKSRGTITSSMVLPETNERIYLSAFAANPIYFDSLNRISKNYEYIPKYYGSFEIFIKNKSMRLINDVDVENYLRSVVPSEMPTTGGIEGYKTQAVAARTYVLSDMLSGRFAKDGFYVDDTIKSQVYNSNPSNPICDSAIVATKGQVLTYNNRIIDAKYYSTSCGVGAPFNEVYYNNFKDLDKNTEPYLTFNNYTTSKISNLSNEFDASNFLKDWTIKSYDSNSPYFRWKFSYDMNYLNNLINKNIYAAFNSNPDSYRKKFIFEFYKHVKIPKKGIGKISDIYISKRGQGGNVLEMTLVTDTGTYKIEKETNIKRLFKSKDLQITSLFGNILKDGMDKDVNSLPSGFFVIDKELSNGNIKSITVYGGGFGHGVGMSQYGVIGLVRLGKTYENILTTFYKHIKFDDFQRTLSNSY
jgi:stage II sporulation protein D